MIYGRIQRAETQSTWRSLQAFPTSVPCLFSQQQQRDPASAVSLACQQAMLQLMTDQYVRLKAEFGFVRND